MTPGVELLWITPEPAQHIERAGRVCYKSEDKITPESAAAFVKKIKSMGHLSVLEHASASFLIRTDRGITHEAVRHRIASFAQESTRYVNYDKRFGLQVIPPEGLTGAQFIVWADAMAAAAKAYEKLIELGCSPQQARDVLPTCTKADLVFTANFREWLHVIDLRTSSAAHPKIRTVINEVRRILVANCPEVFA
jgi:thymidylate synthase (FAD)